MSSLIFENILSLFLFLRLKHTLPDLPYDYNALEPVISADIMKVCAHYIIYSTQTDSIYVQYEDEQHQKRFIYRLLTRHDFLPVWLVADK
jgi:hypothetical protein